MLYRKSVHIEVNMFAKKHRAYLASSPGYFLFPCMGGKEPGSVGGFKLSTSGSSDSNQIAEQNHMDA